MTNPTPNVLFRGLSPESLSNLRGKNQVANCIVLILASVDNGHPPSIPSSIVREC